MTGDSHLGGVDFTNRLVEYFMAEIKKNWKRDIKTDIRAMIRLRVACEAAKKMLTSHNVAKIELGSLVSDKNFTSTITRAKFDEICGDLFKNAIKFVQKSLNDARMDKSMIDEIILIGGSTRICKIQSNG